MTRRLEGRARRLGDDINTDYIITSRRKRDTLDESLLKRYLLETIDPAFAATVNDGDILVAGRNFGCGSAMEIAVTVILAAGIRVVVAESFARSFFRNAINNGLVPVTCDTRGVREGDRLEVDLGAGKIVVANLTRSASVTAPPLPEHLLEILESGGLVPYMQRHGRSWS